MRVASLALQLTSFNYQLEHVCRKEHFHFMYCSMNIKCLNFNYILNLTVRTRNESIDTRTKTEGGFGESRLHCVQQTEATRNDSRQKTEDRRTGCRLTEVLVRVTPLCTANSNNTERENRQKTEDRRTGCRLTDVLVRVTPLCTANSNNTERENRQKTEDRRTGCRLTDVLVRVTPLCTANSNNTE